MKRAVYPALILLMLFTFFYSSAAGKEETRSWNEIHSDIARQNAQSAFNLGNRQFNEADYEAAKLSYESVLKHIKELETYNAKTSGDKFLEEMANEKINTTNSRLIGVYRQQAERHYAAAELRIQEDNLKEAKSEYEASLDELGKIEKLQPLAEGDTRLKSAIEEKLSDLGVKIRKRYPPVTAPIKPSTSPGTAPSPAGTPATKPAPPREVFAPPVPSPKTPEFGSLIIRTEPPGATIAIDGQPIAKTPDTLEIESGKHKITLTRDGYAKIDKSIEIEAGKTQKISFSMPTEYVKLFTYSDPEDAQVYVDAHFKGNAGGEIQISPGDHQLRVTREGYGDYNEQITILPGQDRTIKVRLTKIQDTGTLKISSVPGEALVEADGKAAGNTPITLTLLPGKHTVIITKEGYLRQIRLIELKTGDSKEITVVMPASIGPAKEESDTRISYIGGIAILVLLLILLALWIMYITRGRGKHQPEVPGLPPGSKGNKETGSEEKNTGHEEPVENNVVKDVKAMLGSKEDKARQNNEKMPKVKRIEPPSRKRKRR
ncbi:MAG: PEGA domain-containing protein [Chloroflexi bacterium]|nr:PEGA domain-containing protein [Chloroflexota bacterium]